MGSERFGVCPINLASSHQPNCDRKQRCYSETERNTHSAVAAVLSRDGCKKVSYASAVTSPSGSVLPPAVSCRNMHGPDACWTGDISELSLLTEDEKSCVIAV